MLTCRTRLDSMNPESYFHYHLVLGIQCAIWVDVQRESTKTILYSCR